MLARERQNRILEMVKNGGAVTTSGLVKKFGVSIETIRKDLLLMERQGLLSRVHGGAIAKNSLKQFPALRERNKEYIEQKKSIAYTAVQMIQNGEIIGVDVGSTAIHVANAIKESLKKVTVVTHSLDVFDILKETDGVRVILCGGQFMASENTFYGPLTLEMFSRLRMNKIFLFPAIVSLRRGICNNSADMCMVQKQMIASADEVYILADSSKFEKTALYKLDDMKEEYKYITDPDLSDELKTLYRENAMQIYTGE